MLLFVLCHLSLESNTLSTFDIPRRGLRGSPDIDYCDLHADDYEDFADDCDDTDCLVVECTDPNSLSDNARELECIRDFCRKVCVLEDLRGCTRISTELMVGIFVTIVALICVTFGVIACCYCGCVVRRAKQLPTAPVVPPQAVPELYPAYPTAGIDNASASGYGELEDIEYASVYEYQPGMYGDAPDAYASAMEEYPPPYPQ
jgi:hypothetical protein